MNAPHAMPIEYPVQVVLAPSRADDPVQRVAQAHGRSGQPVLLLGAALEPAAALACYRQGLRGWLPADSSPDLVHRAIAALAAGECWFPRKTMDLLLRLAAQAPSPGSVPQGMTLGVLTAREQAVVRELVNGKANKQIATTLFISEQTVKVHLKNAFGKLKVRSRVELILKCTDQVPVAAQAAPVPSAGNVTRLPLARQPRLWGAGSQ